MPKGTIKAALIGAFAGLALLAPPAEAATLKFAGATPALTMDPHSTNDFVTTAIFRQVYDSLVGLDVKMDLVPSIATAWTYRGDGVWRFTLRQGVKFHDGSALTADDVTFSIMRQKASRFYTALYGDIKSATKVDETTVDVATNRPDPILPRKMSRMFIMSKAWSEKNDVVAIPDLGAKGAEGFSVRNANGTGPMRLVQHDPSVRTVFARHKDFWGAYPGNVEEATYLPIGSAPTRLAALLSGEVDIVVDLPLQDIERVKATPALKVAQTPQLLWMQLEVDGTRDQALLTTDKAGAPLAGNPLKDVRVRQAMAHAIDAKLIVERVMRGHARVVGISSTPGIGGYQPDLDTRWPTDLAKAKELLTQAGYPNGFATTLNCPLERYVNTDEICRAVAAMLARVGIDVKVNGIVWPDFARMLVNGPTSSFHLIGAGPNSWDTQDAFTATMMTRDAAKNQGFFNWALWTNAEFDKVTMDLVAEFDEAKRNALYRRGLTIARDSVHAIYLHQPMITFGMKQGIEAPIRPDATLTLEHVKVR